MGMDEARRIASLLEELRAQPRRDFVDLKEFPVEHGVYVIYGPSVSVLYVGLSKGDKNGLRGRLKGHLHGSRGLAPSPAAGKKLKEGYSVRYLVVKDTRERALLEHLATGVLCPSVLGTG